MIPTDSADVKEISDRVTAILRKKELRVDTTTWKRRMDDYKACTDRGTLYEVAEAFNDLLILRGRKQGNFGFCEQMYLDNAGRALVARYSEAMGCSQEESRTALSRAIKRRTYRFV